MTSGCLESEATDLPAAPQPPPATKKLHFQF